MDMICFAFDKFENLFLYIQSQYFIELKHE